MTKKQNETLKAIAAAPGQRVRERSINGHTLRSLSRLGFVTMAHAPKYYLGSEFYVYITSAGLAAI